MENLYFYLGQPVSRPVDPWWKRDAPDWIPAGTLSLPEIKCDVMNCSESVCPCEEQK